MCVKLFKSIYLHLSPIVWSLLTKVLIIIKSRQGRSSFVLTQKEKIKRIVFFGDSLIRLYPLNFFYKGIPVENKGRSGDTVALCLKRFEKEILPINPSYVLLLIGVNDILLGKDAGFVLEKIRDVVDIIKKSCIDMGVCSLLPIGQCYVHNEENEIIKKTNLLLKSLAKSYQLDYVELWDYFQDSKGLLKSEYTYDGLHLNLKGYAVFTGIMKELLQHKGVI